MNERLSNFYTWSRRYISLNFLTMCGIIIYLCFFNDNSVTDMYRYQQEIDTKRAEIKSNLDTIRYYETMLERLRTDPETMERIVREQYHMQRPNEDIYIVK